MKEQVNISILFIKKSINYIQTLLIQRFKVIYSNLLYHIKFSILNHQ